MKKLFQKSAKTAKFAGLSLLEALLALAVGGVVMTESFYGLSKYTASVQVQATASELHRLNTAAQRFAQDNYKNLVAAAPESLPISNLAPYYGNNIALDAFKDTFSLSTRTYKVTVPDPTTGGTKQINGLQILVVADKPTKSDLDTNPNLRVDIATTAGGSAGFVSTKTVTCPDGTGNQRPPNNICGAFGSYSFNASDFPATDFSKVAYVSLVTAGDGSVYGDQLYRYNYGDPELNTMHTDILANNNDIKDPKAITGLDTLTMNGTANSISTDPNSSPLTIQSTDGTLTLNAGNQRVEITDAGGSSWPTVAGSGGRLSLDNNKVSVGTETNNAFDGTHDTAVGTGTLEAGNITSTDIKTAGIDSLHSVNTDPLRIQKNVDNSETIFGKRVRYSPPGQTGSSGTYELSDGQITARNLKAQDITCADCGGSLSAILPRWRHMGTYLIPDGNGWIVQKPNCNTSRTDLQTRGSTANNAAYMDGTEDTRYVPKIIMIPKAFAFGSNTNQSINDIFNFYASDIGWAWIAYSQASAGESQALAETYCVFLGPNANPTSGPPQLPTGNTGNWTRIE